MRRVVFLVGCWVAVCMTVSVAAEPGPTLVTTKHRELVPHRLLALLHAPEVHDELGLSSDQVDELESWFAKVDGPWFRSRIQPTEAQNAEMDRLEESTRAWMAEHWTSDQRKRIQQLEWQSLGARMMLRTDFATALNVTPDQQRQFASLAQSTESATKAASSKPKNGAFNGVNAAAKALQAEQEGVRSILKPDQQRRFGEVVGPAFQTDKLKRIYPMAPELVPTKTWFNSEPFTLESLRGQVVLVHFYAFQCHNCQANFNIYKRWHDKLREQGVVVLGIQTPETAAERDPKAVCAAAVETKLQFPIVIDLQSENWKAWGNTMWPTVYVIDKRGYIRHWWQGELNWQGATADQTIENVVAQALAEPDPS